MKRTAYLYLKRSDTTKTEFSPTLNNLPRDSLTGIVGQGPDLKTAENL